MGEKIVLLVEDNPDDETLICRALKRMALWKRVVVVRDGREALDYVFAMGQYDGRDPDRLPDVVLLDLKLPKLDGLQVLRQLRADEHTRLLPVVVLTSSTEYADIQSSYRLGANSFIRKPVGYDKYMDAIQQLSNYWLDFNMPPPTRRVF